jgi:hypothetical protein
MLLYFKMKKFILKILSTAEDLQLHKEAEFADGNA